MLQRWGSELPRAQRVWAAAVVDKRAFRLHFAVPHQSLKPKRYRIVESALADFLLPASSVSKKLAALHVDKDS